MIQMKSYEMHMKECKTELNIVCHSFWSNDRTLPVNVVPNEGQVEGQAEELSGDEEQKVEEDVHDVLGQDQGVQAVALVYRILVVSLQLVKSNDLQGQSRKGVEFVTLLGRIIW